mmetsp:Transcript_46691/g.80394  ORF Transcript_46691/g.80394 Transcript_46691/m.80394 type:complete len:95 (-) Transcript_46691:596-880(-)
MRSAKMGMLATAGPEPAEQLGSIGLIKVIQSAASSCWWLTQWGLYGVFSRHHYYSVYENKYDWRNASSKPTIWFSHKSLVQLTNRYSFFNADIY